MTRFLGILCFLLVNVRGAGQTKQINSCPLRKYEVISDDIDNGAIIDPKPGISFRSSVDTVYSITNSTITKIRNYKTWFAVTVQDLKEVQITYYYLNKCFFKEGDNLKRGEYFGTLPEYKNNHILWIIIKKKGIILNPSKHLEFILNCKPLK